MYNDFLRKKLNAVLYNLFIYVYIRVYMYNNINNINVSNENNIKIT